MILNIENYVNNKLEILKEKYKSINNPTLYILTDDLNGATSSYKKSKIKLGEKLGVNVIIKVINTVEELQKTLSLISTQKAGCILQLPFQNKKIVDYYMEFKPLQDVDGFFRMQELFDKNYTISPCTPKGMYEYLLDNYNNLRGKYAVLVGKGNLTNKPFATMLINEGVTTSVIDSKTPISIKKDMLKKADIVVCSTGKKGSVKSSELADFKDVLVFNCGIVFDNDGKLDTELEIDINKNNIHYTPRIKGVGILTTYTLFNNLYNLLSGDK